MLARSQIIVFVDDGMFRINVKEVVKTIADTGVKVYVAESSPISWYAQGNSGLGFELNLREKHR